MEYILNVAAHISQRYFSEYNEQIDEMKLHRLMYFVQRESLIQTGEPLFDAVFYGYKYGPVLNEIRDTPITAPKDFTKDCSSILDKVFTSYAKKDSWSLSRLTQGEISWKNSMLPENTNHLMSLEDICKDAERMKSRRQMLKKLGFI